MSSDRTLRQTSGVSPRTVDRGSILPIALVLTLVLGSVSVALARYVATSLRTTRVTDDRVDRLAAADSAMQIALTQLDGGTCGPSRRE
jgi:Tfp pilus assembly protein PilX